jgi:membrane-associated phospholipid phosphatase
MGILRQRRVLIVAPFAFGAGAAVSSCARKAPPSGDAGAARWRTIVGLPEEALRLPPPPAPGSAAARDELDELLRRQAARTPAAVSAGRAWERGASLRWNEIARDLVAQHRTDILKASRVYALLGAAQHDACVAAFRNKQRFHRPPPHRTTPRLRPADDGASAGPAYPCLHAAIAAASATVLGRLFPQLERPLEVRAAEHGESRITLGASARSDVDAGRRLGRQVGAAVVEHREGDGASAASPPALPPAAGGWTPPETRPPLGSGWAGVRPWVLDRAAQFRAPPPPAPGSPAFQAALGEVRRLSDAADEEQARIAALWADGAGSYTPAGRWNKIAADLIARERLDEARAARCFALLNLALMDAGIACWDTKFHYGLLRPSQADPRIRTPVGLPSFPSYTSAHACFSGAGAGLLSQLFPGERAFLQAKAEEAAVSRMYGGIHYRFDADRGLAQGARVAELVWSRRGREGAS